jgi:hypothetical protein
MLSRVYLEAGNLNRLVGNIGWSTQFRRSMGRVAYDQGVL